MAMGVRIIYPDGDKLVEGPRWDYADMDRCGGFVGVMVKDF